MKLSIFILLFSFALLTDALAATVTATATVSSGDASILAARLSRLNKNTCKQVGLPVTCTDGEVKAKDPALSIYATANAWRSDLLAKALVAEVKAEQEARAVNDVGAAYKAASPATQAQVDALLGVQ